MLKYIIDFFNKIDPILTTVNIIWCIILAIISFKGFTYLRNKFIFDRILGISVFRIRQQIEIRITLPFYTKEFTNFDYPTVTYGELEAVVDIQEQLIKFNIESKIAVNSINTNKFSGIHIGGPAANLVVNALFARRIKNFKAHTKFSKEFFEEAAINKECIEFNSDFLGCTMQLGNIIKKFEYIDGEKDYVFIAKLCEDKVNLIIFGIELTGTKIAVKYFLDHYQEIYKKFEGNDFFIALETSIEGSVAPLSSCINLLENL